MPEQDPTREKELVRKAQQGDEDAFGALYQLHAPHIYRFLVANLGNRQEAEDLTTEIFLRVWRAMPEYQESGFPFKSFLFRVARNLLIDVYRSRGRTEMHLSLEETGLDELLPDPDQLLPETGQYEALHRALMSVREDYREVLVYRFLNDLSVEEIAQIMNRSTGAVRVLQHRALAAIRKALTRAGEQTG